MTDAMYNSAMRALSNTFVMYFKAHTYHWNVEGNDWFQLHSFFGTIYNELWVAIDVLAESIRVMGRYAPISLEHLYRTNNVPEDASKPSTGLDMIKNLNSANDIVLIELTSLLVELNKAECYGFANSITDRITAHEKHRYMLQSFLRTTQ